MGTHINWILEGKKGLTWVKVGEDHDKTTDAFFAMFVGSEGFDPIIGTKGYPTDTAEKIYPDANEAYHGWLNLDELFVVDWDKPQTLNGVPVVDGMTWRQYLSDVVYGDASDENDVDDFFKQFKAWEELGAKRILYYLDF